MQVQYGSRVTWCSFLASWSWRRSRSKSHSILLWIQTTVHLDEADGDGGGDHVIHRQCAERQRHRVGAVEACAETMTNQRVFWQTLARATGRRARMFQHSLSLEIFRQYSLKP